MLSPACLIARTIAAEDGRAEIAKPLLGIGSGASEIAFRNPRRFPFACRFGETLGRHKPSRPPRRNSPTAGNSKDAVWAFDGRCA